MKASVDCIPCVFLQALNTSKRITDDEQELVKAQHELMELLPSLSLDMTPAELSYYVIKHVYEMFKARDPYRDDKNRNNELMMTIYPKIEKIADYSRDKKYTALKIAAAGNIIDLGIKDSFDVSVMITKVLDGALEIDHYDELMRDLEKAKNVLYLADNAGEIVGDMLFLSTLDRNDIKVAVKDKPILNDATIEDAEQIGLTAIAEVISNGSGMLGTIISDCSEEFVKTYNKADLIISKGQANFESLEGARKNIYFILVAKCNLIAEHLGVNVGDTVLMRGKPGRKKKPQTVVQKTEKE